MTKVSLNSATWMISRDLPKLREAGIATAVSDHQYTLMCLSGGSISPRVKRVEQVQASRWSGPSIHESGVAVRATLGITASSKPETVSNLVTHLPR